MRATRVVLPIGALLCAATASAQPYKITIDSSGTPTPGTYNHDLRFGATLLWQSGTMNTFSRYMNGNFDSAGNPLVGTGSTGQGAAWRVSAADGSFLEGPVDAGNASIRSVVEVGGRFYYGIGGGTIRMREGSLSATVPNPSDTPLGAGGVLSLVAHGNTIWAGGDDGFVRRYTVDPLTGGLTLSATSAATVSGGAAVRGMQLFNGRLYASSGSGGVIRIFDAGGSVTMGDLGTLQGTTPGFNNEGFSIFTMGGRDWYVGAEMVNAGLTNALTVRQLTSFNQLSGTADYYRYAVVGGDPANAFNLGDNNSGLTGLSINAAAGVGYFGSNNNAGLWAYGVSVVPVPEPSTVLAVGAGAGLVVTVFRRRGRKTAAKEAR
jgi:hypothetical protein